jgi:hypothetical protein
MSEHDSARRRFLVHAAVAASAMPLLAKLASQPALAALPPLPTSNAQAKALSYTEDATTVKNPMFKAGSDCANCQFFTADTGACAIFPGFAVAAKGWCSGWALKKA